MSAPIGVKGVVREVLRTKSGVTSFCVLIGLLVLSLIMPLYAPYDVAKAWNIPEAWIDNPKNAAPDWTDMFLGRRLSRTVIVEWEEFRKTSRIEVLGPISFKYLDVRSSFIFDYDEFPSEIKIEIKAETKKSVKVDVLFARPDGDEILLSSTSLTSKDPEIILDDKAVKPASDRYWKELGGSGIVPYPYITLFATKDSLLNQGAEVLKGKYVLEVRCMTTDTEADVNARLVVYGRVFGLAGTDFRRRDLLVGILWGAPVALAFGVIAALSITIIQMLFGAVSGYFGGRIDDGIQRVTEIMMILPFLPILILISFFYRTTVWGLLLIIVFLSLVGGTTKVIRSMVPQIREEQYILAALSYGASSWRILLRHVIPRVLPYTLSIIAMSVPGYIFLEAGLSILGLGDPVLPTWGKILSDAHMAEATYHGYWWWVLIPAGFIGITAFSFALLGYAFDKIVNPRLREM